MCGAASAMASPGRHEHRVAGLARRDGGEEMRRPRQRRAKVRAGPDERLHPLGRSRAALSAVRVVPMTVQPSGISRRASARAE
jgi:hypothetical protein